MSRAYRDPTADAAIGHVMWEEKMKKRAMEGKKKGKHPSRAEQRKKRAMKKVQEVKAEE